MRAVREKLRARRGMTLSEVLVALLILSLVTVGMASGIGASLRVYRQATEASDAQMLASTLSIALMDELRYARDIQADGSFTSDTFGEGVSVGLNDGYVEIGNEKLLSEAAYAGLRVKDPITVTYADGVFRAELTIQSGAGDRDVQTAGFSVRALNAAPVTESAGGAEEGTEGTE